MGKKKLVVFGEEQPKKQGNKEKNKLAKVPGLAGGQKVKDMSATAVIVEEPSFAPVPDGTGLRTGKPVLPSKPPKPKKVRGKKYQNAKKMIDQKKVYSIEEVIKLAKKSSYSKFGGSIEVHFNVTKKGLTGEAQLPYLKGKEKKVAIVSPEILEKIKAGKFDFDILLATPADMPKLIPFAKVLGPKGLMPNPKNGTIVPDPEKAKAKFGEPKFIYKTESDFPLIHTIIGKFDQKDEELIANFNALVKAIIPTNIQKATIKSSMGPGIKVSCSY